MFFQVDDQFQVSEKTKKLARMALGNDIRGLAALGVWTIAGSMCQASLTDGVVTVEDLVSITLNHAMSLELADLLVSAGLWHGESHSCERCPAVAPGSWMYHDWFAMGYDRAYQVKTKREKSKELKDRHLIASVWARDCLNPDDPNIGACRYCGTTLHKKDTRSLDGPQMDHVDPLGARGAENVALACGPCNRKKAQRTPEAAGMTLRPAPAHNDAAGPVQTRSPEESAAEQQSQGSPSTGAKGPGCDQTSARTTVETTAEPLWKPQRKGVLACAGDRAGAGRAGQGKAPKGFKNGSGEVSRADPKPHSGTPRKRRRGKGRNSRAGRALPTEPRGTASAGKAPEGRAPGQFGSPWHNWTGPRSEVTETTCTLHEEEQPCRGCIRENQ